jgi:hypothetical protein
MTMNRRQGDGENDPRTERKPFLRSEIEERQELLVPATMANVHAYRIELLGRAKEECEE